jgi:hypothetical protein
MIDHQRLSRTKAGEGYAAISLAKCAATFRQHLLRGPKSLRPRTPKTLSHRRPPASPQRDRALEGRGWDSRMIALNLPGAHSFPLT